MYINSYCNTVYCNLQNLHSKKLASKQTTLTWVPASNVKFSCMLVISLTSGSESSEMTSLVPNSLVQELSDKYTPVNSIQTRCTLIRIIKPPIRMQNATNVLRDRSPPNITRVVVEQLVVHGRHTVLPFTL